MSGRRADDNLGDGYRVFAGNGSAVAGSDRFRFKPQGLQIVATVEITVRDELGSYMLVMCPRYGEVEHDDERSAIPHEIETGQWTPPFIRYRVPFDQPPPTVGRMVRVFERERKKLSIEDDVRRYVDSLSCGLGDAQPIGELIEYKRSWGSPGTRKAYLILRYAVDTADCDTQALADSELLKGFRFLPIDDDGYERVTHRRRCENHDVEHVVFMRKPLATNLAHVLEDQDTRRALRQRAVEVPRDRFFDTHDGILFCGDIANYGAACEYANKLMGLLPRSGQAHLLGPDDVLRESAIVTFTRMFLEAGASHVHTAGDGFLCGIPCRKEELSQTLDGFLAAYLRLLELLELNNRALADHARRSSRTAPQLGSRLAIHVGDYRYGKMGLAASLVPAFDGAGIIDVSRLEQGLRDRIKKQEAQRLRRGERPPARHQLIVSREATERLGRLEHEAVVPNGTCTVHSKESRQRASLYVVDPPAAPPPVSQASASRRGRRQGR